jgi:hypothetical protein
MNVIDFSIIVMGGGLLALAYLMRGTGTKRNWIAFFAGGCTMLLLEVLSKIFGFSL